MLDASRPFIDSLNVTKPYLVARSVAGTLLAIAHGVFIYHFTLVVLRRSPARQGAAYLGPVPPAGAMP